MQSENSNNYETMIPFAYYVDHRKVKSYSLAEGGATY